MTDTRRAAPHAPIRDPLVPLIEAGVFTVHTRPVTKGDRSHGTAGRTGRLPWAMPYRLFHTGQHDAATIQLMSDIFDEVCTELGLANRDDQICDLIASEIMDCV